MSTRIARLASIVAALKARKLAEAAAPLTVAELEASGFTVYPFPDGLAVDDALGLAAKLDELQARGISPGLVCILRNFDSEQANGAADAGGNGDRAGEGTGASSSPARSPRMTSTRVSNPTTTRRHDA